MTVRTNLRVFFFKRFCLLCSKVTLDSVVISGTSAFCVASIRRPRGPFKRQLHRYGANLVDAAATAAAATTSDHKGPRRLA